MRSLIAIIGIWILTITMASAQIITTTFQNKPLEQVIQQLDKDYNLNFSYDNTIVQNIEITASFNQANLQKVLTTIFKQTRIDFEVFDKQSIILKPKPKEQLILKRKQSLQKIGGILTDSLTNKPMEFVTILIKNQQKGTTTNELGEFELTGYFTPQDTVKFSYVGYKTQKILVKTLQEEDCPTIKLNYKEIAFERIVIRDYLSDGVTLGASYEPIDINFKQVKSIPGFVETDVLQMTQLLPGITNPNENAADIYIRGGTPDHNLILLDDISIYNSGHFFGMTSVFNPALVDKVKVFRGGFGAEYGGRISGVVAIQTPETIPNEPIYEAGLNLTHGYGAAKLPVQNGKGALYVAARRSISDLLESYTYNNWVYRIFQTGKIIAQDSIISNGDTDLNTYLEYRYFDANLKWLYQPTQKETMGISTFVNGNRLTYETDDNAARSSTDGLDLNNIGLSAFWQKKFSQSYETKASLSYSYLDYSYTYFDLQDTSDFLDFQEGKYNEVHDLTFKWHNEFRLDDNQLWSLGYQLTNYYVGLKLLYEYRLGNNIEQIETTQGNIHAIYTDYTWSKLDKFILNTGLRLSYVPLLNKGFVEPRLAIRYQINDNLDWKMGAGQYFQFISQVIEFNDLGAND